MVTLKTSCICESINHFQVQKTLFAFAVMSISYRHILEQMLCSEPPARTKGAQIDLFTLLLLKSRGSESVQDLLGVLMTKGLHVDVIPASAISQLPHNFEATRNAIFCV